MLKQKIQSKTKFKLAAILAGFSLIVAGWAAGGLGTFAATCNSISDCQSQINKNNNAVASLQSQATSYQNAISLLQGQINQKQTIINANVAQQADLQKRIDQAQVQLDKQKKTLAENIKALYLEGDTTTVEILASSKNLSQFVDRQTYRNVVADKVKTSLDTIRALQSQMKAQKNQLDSLIASEQAERNQLAQSQNQQQQYLSYNQGQVASFNAQTADNQAKLNDLIAAQRRANSAISVGSYYFIHFPGALTADPINGSYPYADWPFSMSLGGCTTDGPDAWGYCTRQCVSYAAWAVAYSGRAAPIGWGNAADWVGAAQSAGLQFDSYPQAGDVAISTSGTWGHAMYVESVSGSTFTSLEYNTYLDGDYHIMTRSF